MKELLYYPDAMEWMWNYCIYLGRYTDYEDNVNYDLGAVYTHEGWSLAAVYGNEQGQYLSGNIHRFDSDIYKEAIYRLIQMEIYITPKNTKL